jgi:predicted membrane channel-forming protein YqfA (hemolysin III family)
MKRSYILLFALLFVAGLGDCVSTAYGLSMPSRFVETRSYYFPFLSTLILGVACFSILFATSKIKRSYRSVGYVLTSWLVVLSFTGLGNNLYLFFFQ